MTKYRKTLAGIQRTDNQPFEADTVFESLAKAQEYVKGPTAYAGQIIGVKYGYETIPCMVGFRVGEPLSLIRLDTGYELEAGGKKIMRHKCDFVWNSSGYSSNLHIPIDFDPDTAFIRVTLFAEYEGKLFVTEGHWANGVNSNEHEIWIDAYHFAMVINLTPEFYDMPQNAECIIEANYLYL